MNPASRERRKPGCTPRESVCAREHGVRISNRTRESEHVGDPENGQAFAEPRPPMSTQ